MTSAGKKHGQKHQSQTPQTHRRIQAVHNARKPHGGNGQRKTHGQCVGKRRLYAPAVQIVSKGIEYRRQSGQHRQIQQRHADDIPRPPEAAEQPHDRESLLLQTGETQVQRVGPEQKPGVVDTFTAAGKPGAMTFYGLGSYGVMAAIALVLSTAMGVIGTPTHRTRIYTSKDEKTARKAFLGQGILLFGWSFVTAIIGMSCFTIATMNGDTLASGDYAFAYMATNALPPVIGMMFMICGLSATMSSGDSDAISGVTILLTDVYPSVTGKTIKEEDYAKYSRIALICTLGAAFFITLFVNDVIGYISTIVGAFLPGVAVAMLLGRFWKRVNWQGGLACIGSGTLLGVLILVLPSFKNWINATMGGPAVPATIISLVFGIVVSLMFPADTTPDDVRLKHVMDDRRGTVVEKVAAAEAAAEEEEDL